MLMNDWIGRRRSNFLQLSDGRGNRGGGGLAPPMADRWCWPQRTLLTPIRGIISENQLPVASHANWLLPALPIRWKKGITTTKINK